MQQDNPTLITYTLSSRSKSPTHEPNFCDKREQKRIYSFLPNGAKISKAKLVKEYAIANAFLLTCNEFTNCLILFVFQKIFKKQINLLIRFWIGRMFFPISHCNPVFKPQQIIHGNCMI